jgi:hypothetical protein
VTNNSEGNLMAFYVLIRVVFLFQLPGAYFSLDSCLGKYRKTGVCLLTLYLLYF